jgi:hypothetical protein
MSNESQWYSKKLKNALAVGSTRTKILLLVILGTQIGSLPTIRDLGRATRTLPNSVIHHLTALRKDGLLTWDGHTARSIRGTCMFIPADALDAVALPG